MHSFSIERGISQSSEWVELETHEGCPCAVNGTHEYVKLMGREIMVAEIKVIHQMTLK